MNMQSDNSFLTEDQLEGKASGDVHLQDLDDAINKVFSIINEDAVQFYKKSDESEWPQCKISVYNHELKQIVPAGIGQTLKGNARTVCGLTGSKKISIGKEDVLKNYYHIKEIPQEELLENAKQFTQADGHHSKRKPTHKRT